MGHRSVGPGRPGGDLDYYAIELQNPDAADAVSAELFAAFRQLASTPELGHLRRDLADESLRFWRVRSYLIIYRSGKRPLQIVRVLHAARDIRAILNEPPDGEDQVP